MRYLLMIYAPEGAPADPSEDQQAAEMKRWFDYTDEMRAAGVHIAGDALMPSDTATTVRVRDGELVTSDGPFAETKEVLGGYYLMEVRDLDDAVEWARRCPAAEYGSVELRPVVEFPDAPDA